MLAELTHTYEHSLPVSSYAFPERSIRHDGMNKTSIGISDCALIRQVLFKRKPVQYLPRPLIQDEDTEVSWDDYALCFPIF
jgi:hypothetical protein